MPEELETILRLVAEGTLSPEEAAPIIDALTRAERAVDEGEELDRHHRRAGRHADRFERRIASASRRLDRALDRGFARVDAIGATVDTARHGHHLRIRITERGRQVVNLRIPVGFVDAALGFVPGLGGDQAERIREAVRAGDIGPILDVEDADGAGGVLISVE